ncbi:MAG: ZPR1 zinc finger domain-containing protein [Candidatus Bathyarchaeia archaeon]
MNPLDCWTAIEGIQMGVGSYEECPACRSEKAMISQSEEEIPYIGPVVLLAVKCSRCGFKYNDIIYLATKEPSFYSIKVTGVEDLKTRVVRSATAHIKIPELKVDVTPGPQAESYISNIEGILLRVEDAVKALITLTQNPRQRRRQLEYLDKIRMAREGKIPFTLIIRDPQGLSALIPQNDKKVKKRRLTMREIELLTRPKTLQTSLL